jgi:hypothetical protein
VITETTDPPAQVPAWVVVVYVVEPLFDCKNSSTIRTLRQALPKIYTAADLDPNDLDPRDLASNDVAPSRPVPTPW